MHTKLGLIRKSSREWKFNERCQLLQISPESVTFLKSFTVLISSIMLILLRRNEIIVCYISYKSLRYTLGDSYTVYIKLYQVTVLLYLFKLQPWLELSETKDFLLLSILFKWLLFEWVLVQNLKGFKLDMPLGLHVILHFQYTEKI